MPGLHCPKCGRLKDGAHSRVCTRCFESEFSGMRKCRECGRPTVSQMFQYRCRSCDTTYDWFAYNRLPWATHREVRVDQEEAKAAKAAKEAADPDRCPACGYIHTTLMEQVMNIGTCANCGKWYGNPYD